MKNKDPEEYKEFDNKFPENMGLAKIWRKEIKSFISQNFIPKSTLKNNIGMLRQWLNEKPANFRLLTNEDLETFLLEQQ